MVDWIARAMAEEARSIPRNSLGLANVDTAVKNALRPANVALPFYFMKNAANMVRQNIKYDIYSYCQYNGNGSDIVIDDDTVIVNQHFGTKFTIEYMITFEMRRWGSLSF
ncbi:hypothetical protein [Paenibacillus sp. GCM10012303]|uniref:hypothetical protein n=1 Tax=Paenibacillus sp. GCM10012303 TaxID=3317340 RepID=UPI0036150ADB